LPVDLVSNALTAGITRTALADAADPRNDLRETVERIVTSVDG
jgi:hypothetical protein